MLVPHHSGLGLGFGPFMPCRSVVSRALHGVRAHGVVIILRVCGTRLPMSPATCARAVVPPRLAPWPRDCGPSLVRCGPSRCAGRLSRCRGAVTARFTATHVVRRSPGFRVRGCPGHVEAGRQPGSLCLPAGPFGPGLPPRRTSSGPRFGVAPEGSLWRQSWAAFGALVFGLWTRSLMRPVSRTVHSAARLSGSAPRLFCVEAGTLPCGLEAPRPSPVCVCARVS